MQSKQLIECDHESFGPIIVMFSYHFNVKFQSVVNKSEDIYHLPELAHQDYMKDLQTREKYNLSYTEYMECIIDELIINSNCRNDNVCGSGLTAPTHEPYKHILEPHPNLHSSPVTLGRVHADVLTGPDRNPITIKTIEECICWARVIGSTGCPNYKLARIPLNSGLNIPAWEELLMDYPDKHLIEYLKFGIPLSITNSQAIHNQSIVNHHSAIQFPEAVKEYIQQEKAHGTLLGPAKDIQCPHIHCSPLLTRPKDISKRKIILNLSYPKGQSVNDIVDKNKFDNRKFTLKFLSIDDVVRDANAIDDPLIFKIDVARAFRNLRVDPVDSLKLGIRWNDALYVDGGITFGWTHGSAAFLMANDAIVYIMSKAGCQVHAYIDDFLVIAPRNKEDSFFSYFIRPIQKLGLPMNPDKKTPLAKALFVWA